jgi:YesN/AraC family two-component response regulator
MPHHNLTFNTQVLSAEKASDISERLNQLMYSEKPYLQYRYSLKRLANDIHVHAYLLSAYLNHEKHLRFTDYLNQFRIEYCENLIQKGLVNDLNMKGLALSCGFQNRNTLTSAFKKFTGLTPSRYTKTVQLGIKQKRDSKDLK